MIMAKRVIDENTVAVENQVTKDSETYYLGDPSAPLRILALGNSITRHAPKADIGWSGDWGMAASCPQKDYIHRLFEKLCAAGYSCYLCAHQASRWEHSLNEGKADLSGFSVCRDFGADIAVYRLSENIVDAVSETAYAEALRGLMNFVMPKGGKAVYTTSFWRKKTDSVAQAAARETGMPCVFLGDLGDDPAMKAVGLFEHSGVAAHPGDAGMEAIAERIFEALTPLLREADGAK